LSIKTAIPTEANVVNETRLLEVLDKGKAASVTTLVQTRDKATGQLLFENQATVFIRGAGGFGGKRTGADRGAATATNVPPQRAPDVVMEENTSLTQAALYRLSGDHNPLHILPDFAAIGGFDKPILHGLCFMGIAGKHVFKTFGPYKDIKVRYVAEKLGVGTLPSGIADSIITPYIPYRFAGVVYPGETLVTEMWKEGNKVVFVTKTKERGTTVLTSAAVTLADGDKARL
jgi:multifunctional beta-oxidation protein